MKRITPARLAKSVIRTPLLSSVLILALLALAIVTGSIPLLIASGVLAYGRPLLYVALLADETQSGRAPQAQSGRRTARPASTHAVALGTQ